MRLLKPQVLVRSEAFATPAVPPSWLRVPLCPSRAANRLSFATDSRARSATSCSFASARRARKALPSAMAASASAMQQSSSSTADGRAASHAAEAGLRPFRSLALADSLRCGSVRGDDGGARSIVTDNGLNGLAHGFLVDAAPLLGYDPLIHTTL
jgi:hypothetical protein